MSEHSSNLWQQDDFLKLWFGQTISGFGSRFSGLALPLIAISLLGATPGELGLLEAAGGVAWWFVGPFIGTGIDRMRRRPILIAAELGRGMILASIPLAVLFGYLHIEQLYAVALLIGFLSAWFDTAYQSYLPSLVEPEHLIEGNSKLNVSNSAADVAGPGMAGLVIQTIGASVAIALDAFSFLVSGISLILIRKPEPQPGGITRQTMGSALGEGLTYIWRNAILRAFTFTNATFMFSIGMEEAVSILFLTHVLHFTPARIGLIFSIGSVGGLLGALAAVRISKWLKLGPTIIAASSLRGLGLACVPLVALLPSGETALIAALYAIHSFGWSVWAVTQSSTRQSLAPRRLQGRITASFLFIVRGAAPLGSLVGGAVGDLLGVTPTFYIAGIGLLLSTIWLVLSPLWTLRELPLPIDDLQANTV